MRPALPAIGVVGEFEVTRVIGGVNARSDLLAVFALLVGVMFALLVGVSGRSAGAAKLARASAAKSSGRAELATGAWAMSDAYINRTATKSCGEPVQAWCVYRLDTGLVKEMARFFGGSTSVTELGAGVGRYARALTPSVRRYSAYDGMPGIEQRSHGWVTHGDVSSAYEGSGAIRRA